MDRRSKILRGLDIAGMSGVEIGALAWPLVRKSDGDITYVDFADAGALREKYREDRGVPVDQIVDVDAIWGSNTLKQAIGEDRRVDYILASHVVEHVPDLIGWLKELASVLKPAGEIRLVVPDKRFTFDILRRETQIPEVLAAYLAGARTPQPERILDFVLKDVLVDKQAAWDGVLGSLASQLPLEGAMNAVRQAEAGNYVDVHCWVFTPQSLGRLFADLAKHGLLDLECTSFDDTEYGEHEFFISLRPSSDRLAAVASWNKVETEARCLPTPEDELRRENSALAARILALEQSTSWRVTSPLRALGRLLPAPASTAADHRRILRPLAARRSGR